MTLKITLIKIKFNNDTINVVPVALCKCHGREVDIISTENSKDGNKQSGQRGNYRNQYRKAKNSDSSKE